MRNLNEGDKCRGNNLFPGRVLLLQVFLEFIFPMGFTAIEGANNGNIGARVQIVESGGGRNHERIGGRAR